MPWYMPSLGPVSEYVKKKMCIYLLQRYLGQFFEEKIRLDQLSLDVYNGTGTVRNVSLDVQALNELGEKQNWPMEFVDGYLEELYVSVPWTALLSDSTSLVVTGLKLTVQPKQRHESATSVFESMWSSMTSSMQLAKDYIKQENVVDESQPFEGIEKFAQTIDSVLTRIKVKFIDTVIQIEHVPKQSLSGVAMQIHIGTIDYLDEAGSDPSTLDPPLPQDQGKDYVVSSYTTKRLQLDDVSLHTVEFPSAARTFSRSVIVDQKQYQHQRQSQSPEQDKDSLDNLISGGRDDGDEEAEKEGGEVDEGDGRYAVVFGKLTGKQEIRIRLKQSENVSGSKVSIEVTLGGFSMFLSPRQVHVLLELANGISSPDIEDTSNVPPRQKCVEKPMTGLDYQRVEQDLQDQVHPSFGTTGLQGLYGWSKGSIDNDDDSFHPMSDHARGCASGSTVMYDSAVSHTSSSMESSLSSSMVSSISDATSMRSRRRTNIETDPSAEITHFQIRLASLALVLLHEDILSLDYDDVSRSYNLNPSSVAQMKRTAEEFFASLGGYNLTAYGGYNFDDSKPIFERSCQLNHMRLLAAPIQIEGRETTTQTAFSVNGKLTSAKLELLECLYNDTARIATSMGVQGGSSRSEAVQYVRVLHFCDDCADANAPSALRTKPSVRLSFKHEEKFASSGHVPRKGSGIPKTDIGITLDTCCFELDITIVNRISALINGVPVCIIVKPTNNVWSTPLPLTNEKISDTRLDLSVNSPDITVKIRFPVPDLRPKHDMNRRPWWQRDVRPDYVTLRLRDALADTSWLTAQPAQRYGVRCRHVAVSYHETEDCLPVALGQVMSREGRDEQWPSFEIEFRPEVIADVEMGGETVDPMTQSIYPELNPDKSGPFSSTRVMHESDTPHAKLHQDDSEQLVIPGDRAEMAQFIAETLETTRTAITVQLPTVHLDLHSKHIYEVLYNRINGDLLLWEASAPEPAWPRPQVTAAAGFDGREGGGAYYEGLGGDRGGEEGRREGGGEWFGMCKSGIQYDSDTDTSSTDELGPETDSIFQSIYESRVRSRYRSNRMGKSAQMDSKQSQLGIGNTVMRQSELTLHLHIGNGRVRLTPPSRDTSPAAAVLPNQRGELVLLAEGGASVFTVNGYGGDTNLGYVCVQVADAQLHHCDMISMSNPTVPLDKFSETSNVQLHPTVYKSDPGILASSKGDGGQRDMLSVAVKIEANHETHYVKTVKVALGVNKATLRHRMCLEPNTWITQLIDFFNVLDYTIPGYTAKDVLTELHLHLWDCAIDYRPFHLPLRSVVTMGSFSMSSHLSPKSNTSTLRFIAQECQLHLSDKVASKMPNINIAPMLKQNVIHLLRDYIPVVEVRLFELSLRTNDKNSGINPHINLRASNNIVNIHTCADSGKAFIELMTYFAQDGDLTANVTTAMAEETSNAADTEDDVTGHPAANSSCSSPVKRASVTADEELIVVDAHAQNISNLSTSQHQQVNDMLGDAMKDCAVPLENQDAAIQLGAAGQGAQMFFFPDEGQILPDVSSLGKIPPLVVTDLGDVTFRRNKSSDTDEEFCIIGEDAVKGILSRNCTPEIRWLTTTPLIIIDNHFTIPIGKTDILKRPKSCPVPIMEYTLREMTVVWHMYGGNDFDSSAPSNDTNSEKTSGKKVNFKDQAESNEVGCVVFTNARTGEVFLPELNTIQMEHKSGEGKKQSVSSTGQKVRGGKGRNGEVLIELQLSKVKFLHEVYPENGLQASRQVLAINDVEIRDRLKSSNINKFLYQHTSEAKPKQSHAHMVIIKAAHIRPDQKLKAQECSLKVSLLPLRLNIDQDSLLFLITFFSELSGNASNTDDKVASKQNTPTHQPPVMTVSDDNDRELKEQVHKVVDENLLILLEEDKKISENLEKDLDRREMEGSPPIYFRSIIFHPEVPIRLDYHGKRVDMSHGSLPGLLMGLGQLSCSEFRLKRLSYRHGLLGVEKLVSYCLQEWLVEIKRRQLPSLLGGVGPMHSFILLAQGVIDLVRLPIEQYQKDGRIVRGLQRGATSFTTSTAMAALELTSRLIHLIQITAETAYDMMSPGPSVRRRRQHSRGQKRRGRQPQDIRAGAVMAYNVFREGIEETAVNIIRDASHEHEQKGMSGVVGGILRQIPPNVIVKPIILATEATNNLLGGVQNQLVPDAKREANQKWKDDDSSG